MSGLSGKVFIPLNAASAATWAAVIGCAGFAFGKVFEHVLNDARQFERPVILGFVGIGIAIWIWHARHVRLKQ